jgi:hypothetical protein
VLERVENKLLSMVLPLHVVERSITVHVLVQHSSTVLLGRSRAIALVKFCGYTVRWVARLCMTWLAMV